MKYILLLAMFFLCACSEGGEKGIVLHNGKTVQVTGCNYYVKSRITPDSVIVHVMKKFIGGFTEPIETYIYSNDNKYTIEKRQCNY